MTEEQAKGVVKHFECVKAYAENKQIQFLDLDGEWHDTSSPRWYEETKYRVKPEPKIVPFKNMVEFCKAWNYEPIKRKENTAETCEILEISGSGVMCRPSYYTWEYLAENFTFSDGTPCGKEVME